jgi:hypothetical protein
MIWPRKDSLPNFRRALSQLKTEAILLVGIFLGLIWVHKPSRYYFYGDTWDVLYLCMLDLRTVFQPHNEHFIPLFKLLFTLQHKMFGDHHLGYMLVLYALHSLVAVLVYRLAQRVGLTKAPSIAAALVFAFTSVTWEVTGWEFEQQFALGTVFILSALDVFTNPGWHKHRLLTVSLFSLLGLWAGGPIVAALPLALSAYLVLQYAIGVHNTEERLAPTLIALWAPLLIYYVTLRLSLKYFGNLPANHVVFPTPHARLRDIPEMLDFSFYGLGWGILLPSLTFIHSSTMASASLVLIFAVAIAALAYTKLLSSERLYALLLLILMFCSYLVISVGRISYGATAGGASRYQYLASAFFAVFLLLLWRGLSHWASFGHPFWFKAASFCLLLYFLLFHFTILRKENPGADRGLAVQRFFKIARQTSLPSSFQPNTMVLGPELLVPPEVYFPRAMPLWKTLQTLRGNTHDVAPVANYLADTAQLQEFNLITKGSFESTVREKDWMTFSGTQFRLTASAAHSGQHGAEIYFPQLGSAFSYDLARGCIKPKALTYAVYVQTRIPNAVSARIIFKASNGRILSVNVSNAAPGDGMWHQLVVSGISPMETCIVGVDISNLGAGPAAAMVDDAVLLLHPATVNSSGNVLFQPPESLMSKKEEDYRTPTP